MENATSMLRNYSSARSSPRSIIVGQSEASSSSKVPDLSTEERKYLQKVPDGMKARGPRQISAEEVTTKIRNSTQLLALKKNGLASPVSPSSPESPDYVTKASENSEMGDLLWTRRGSQSTDESSPCRSESSFKAKIRQIYSTDAEPPKKKEIGYELILNGLLY